MSMLRTLFFVVIGILGYATVNAQVVAGTRQKQQVRHELNERMRLVPQVIYICSLVIALRVLAIGAPADINDIFLSLQLLILVTANLLIDSTWAFLAIQVCGLAVFATDPEFSGGALAMDVLACLVVYGARWLPQGRWHQAYRFFIPFVAAAMFWGTVYLRRGASAKLSEILVCYAACVWGYLALLDFDHYHQKDQRVVARLTREVQYDALTQVRNWATFQADLNDMFEHKPAPFALIEMDIDHFKTINDRYGHLIGNKVLVRFASTVQYHLGRTVDQARLYRTGGEEFAVILPDMSPEAAQNLLFNLQNVVRQLAVPTNKGTVRLTSSFGMTFCREADANPTVLFRRVDSYLYAAKRAGRDRVTVEGHTD